MHNSKSLVRMFTTLAVIAGALAMLALSTSGALAQMANQEGKQYVMTASGTWGAAQDAAIANAGGNVTYRHVASGIGVATSDDPRFLTRAMRTGLFGQSGADMTVEWQKPSDVRLGDESLIEDGVVTPGDDRFINLLWNMTAIDAPGAWSQGYDGAGVRVAVIDGGMCSLHPDVAPNIDVARSASFVPGFTWDQDAGGAATFRHACHVAGIIAAADNTIGTIGVAPKATIIGCKALHNGSGSFAAVIEAILYAADPIADGGAGANIINMSLGATFAKGGGNTGAGPLVAAMNKAVNYAIDKNVLVVSSAGNNAIDMDHSQNITNVPAQSGSGIAIAATAPQNWAGGGSIGPTTPTTYTNYGHQLVWVSAPGGDSAYPGTENCSVALVSPAGSIVRPCWVFDLVLSPGSQSGSYFFAGGTSMAAPHASGVAALIVQKYPGISVGDLKTLIAQTAVEQNGNGADPYHGHGFLNANNAVSGTIAQSATAPSQGVVRKAPVGMARVELEVAQNAGRSTPSISFTLPTAGPARVDLFDLAGRRVAELFSGSAAAGRTTVTWNGRDASGQQLARGAYFARLTAGNVKQARQIVLLGE